MIPRPGDIKQLMKNGRLILRSLWRLEQLLLELIDVEDASIHPPRLRKLESERKMDESELM